MLWQSSEPRQEDRESARPVLDLYWLGYVLTGDPELSADAVVETLDLDDAGNQSFGHFMLAWSRKIFIDKVLQRVAGELRASQVRNSGRRFEDMPGIAAGWTLDPETDKARLESALLSIDIFRRCVLVLTVLEGLSLDDAAILLNADRELVADEKAIGLKELVRRLAREDTARTRRKEWAPSTTLLFGRTLLFGPDLDAVPGMN